MDTDQPTTGIDKAQEGAEQSVVTVQVNLTELMQLAEDGKTLVFNPAAEDAIISLLDIQDRVNNTVEFVKAEIERAGLEYTPTFTSVGGDRLKANYSASGAKYKEDPDAEIIQRRAPFWTRKVSYSPNGKEVEKYEMKHHGKLPNGIVKAVRKSSIRFNLKKEAV